MEKSGYKYQIEQELKKENWVLKTIDSNTEWWDDEHWKIEFKYDSNLSFFLCFIVDPMFEGDRKSGQGIYEVRASTKFPNNWNDNENEIASISLTKKKFEEKLKLFVEDLKKYKKENTTTKKD